MLRKVINCERGLKLTCGARARSVVAREIVVRGTRVQQKRAGLVDVAGTGDSSRRSLRRVMDAPEGGCEGAAETGVGSTNMWFERQGGRGVLACAGSGLGHGEG